MAPACRRLALRAPLPTLLLPYLVALPSLGKRDHLFAEVELGETALVVEPGPAKSQNVSEIVGAATEQTLEPLQRTQKELQAKLQGLDAKMVELKDNQTALQEEAQREEKRAQTDEKLKRMYTDLLNKAINGLRALEENYTSNTKEGVQLLRCLNGDCGTLGETSIEVLKRQQEIEQQVMEGQEQQLDADPKKDAAAEDKEGIFKWLWRKIFGFEDDETMGQPVPIDEVDPGCQGDFMKQPAAARRHFVGFAKGRGACENRAMVPEGVNQKADFKKAKDAIANDKNISDAEEVLEEEDGTVSARPVEGGSTPSGSVEAQRRDAEESAVSAGSEEGGEEGAEEDGASSSRSRGMPKEEDSAAEEVAPGKAVARGSAGQGATADFGAEEEEANPRLAQTGQLSKRRAPSLGGFDARGVRPGEGGGAPGFAPPSTADADGDVCTEVKYSWNSAKFTDALCLPEGAPMTALLEAVCIKQLGPAGYDIAKCSAEPNVRCRMGDGGNLYAVDLELAEKVTVGDLATAHVACQIRTKV